jgi:predicted amidohydrolase YtcJ
MKKKSGGVSRRDFLKSSALAGAFAGGGGALTAGVVQASEKSKKRRKRGSLVLVNGEIHTMDPRNPVVSSVGIRDGRFVEVGRGAKDVQGAKVINLRGATVIPGLIESHTHFVSLCNRPGYHVAQWELGSNVAEVLAILKAYRAQTDVPAGAFITAMGAGTVNIWFERRQPTLAELDAAVPDRPVFLYFGGGGPARVNTLGMKFFQGVTNPTVTVQPDGAILGGNPSQANAALYHLRIRQTFEDKKRSALDAMAFTAQVGVTTNFDQTLVALNSATQSLDPQPNHGLFNLDHYRMYDAYLALHAEGEAFTRLQINFLHNQGYTPSLDRPGFPVPDLEAQLPELRQRLRNQFQFFGDDMVRTGAIGEWAAPFATPSNANGYAVWLEAQRLCAKARWRNENSQAGSPTDQSAIEQVVATYEMMDAEMQAAGFADGIKSLRWGLQHADHATESQLARLKTLNCGISASGFRWTSNPRADGLPVGPMFPRLVASGIPLALHQDGVHITAHNPWFAIHYATTGLNNGGTTGVIQQINPGQQISRQQALHMFTVGAAWFCNREDDLGSIEKGKLADLVVLDRDIFRVSDADLRKTSSMLTVVDGRIVHDTGALDHGHGKGNDDDDED